VYIINVGTGTVGWNPEHTEHAVTAIQEIVIESFNPDNAPIEIKGKTARQINKRYKELLTNDPDIDYPPEHMRETKEDSE